MFDRLKSALEQADQTAGGSEIDQIVYMLGSFPLHHTVRKAAVDCPRICALLPKDATAPNEQLALMRTDKWIEPTDAPGEVAVNIRGLLQV